MCLCSYSIIVVRQTFLGSISHTLSWRTNRSGPSNRGITLTRHQTTYMCILLYIHALTFARLLVNHALTAKHVYSSSIPRIFCVMSATRTLALTTEAISADVGLTTISFSLSRVQSRPLMVVPAQGERKETTAFGHTGGVRVNREPPRLSKWRRGRGLTRS